MTIVASAPVRICDHGGWTDTWFGGPGRVLNVAVTPGVEVSIRPVAGGGGVVIIDARSLGDRYAVFPGEGRAPRHPLLEAAVDALPPPAGQNVEITVRSAVPPGCGTGTSAAVAVALLGALAVLRGDRLSPRDAASLAHRLEVGALGGESGVQDQLSVALGGINYIEIDEYPEARVSSLPAWDALGERLTLVFLGRAHDSSGVHRQVIDAIRGRTTKALASLREAAVAARDAVHAGDLAAFGQAMIANHEAQSALHPDLVGRDARRVIAAAAPHGAIGWKVNGAGGQGGSVTILSRSADDKEAIEPRIAALDESYRLIPVCISATGLCVEVVP